MRATIALLAAAACASSQAITGFTPAAGFTTFGLGLSGSAIAISPDGKLAVGQDTYSTGAYVQVYDSVLPGRHLLGTIGAPTGESWGAIAALHWLDSTHLAIAENWDAYTAYGATLASGATRLAPLNSMPNIASLAVAFNGDLYADGATNPGTGSVCRIAGGAATQIATGLGTGYLGGLAFANNTLYVGDTDDPFFMGNAGQVLEVGPDGHVNGTISLAGGGGSGCYDILFDSGGNLIATTGATLTRAGQPFGTFSGSFPFPTYLAYTGSRFEPNSGNGLLLVNGTSTGVHDIFAIAPAPEPSVLFLGFALLPLVRRKR